MRDRLSVSRQIQLRELGAGLSLVGFWLVVLLSWPGTDLAVPFLVAAIGGATAVEIAQKVADHLMPGLPRRYRRPLKAALPALALGALSVFVVATLDPYLHGQYVEGVTQRHHILAFMLAFAAAGFSYTLWPPDPIAAPAELSQKLGFDDNPPLFGPEPRKPS